MNETTDIRTKANFRAIKKSSESCVYCDYSFDFNMKGIVCFHDKQPITYNDTCDLFDDALPLPMIDKMQQIINPNAPRHD